MVEVAHDVAELARVNCSGERRVRYAPGVSPAGVAADTRAVERVTH